jgi:predicted RNA binding protein YcfA (HicA-like mRNA interferase family)
MKQLAAALHVAYLYWCPAKTRCTSAGPPVDQGMSMERDLSRLMYSAMGPLLSPLERVPFENPREARRVPRLPRVTARDLLGALRRDGWYVLRHDGSHVRLAYPDRANKVTVAVHAGAIVKAGTLKGILDQAGMSVERLIELL